MAHVAYIRVSTKEQSTARQLAGLDINFDKEFIDKVSGATKERPALIDCIKYLREGDTLHVHSLDRLARSLHDLQDIVKSLTSRGVIVKFYQPPLTFDAKDTLVGTLVLHLLGAFAEFERGISKQRQREGLDRVKETGITRSGRPIGKPSLDPSLIHKAKLLKMQGDSAIDIATRLHISRASVYKLLQCKNLPLQHAKESTLDHEKDVNKSLELY